MKTSFAFQTVIAAAGLCGAMPPWAAELDGALVAAVFDGSATVYAPTAPALSPSARTCRAAYLRALPRPLSRDAGQTLRAPKRLLAARRDFLAHQTAALVGGRGGDDAHRFAQSLTLHMEWEGLSEAPLLEARQAMQWAEENPASPVVPAAQLFAAHRYRAAYECATLAGDAATAAPAAAAWREALGAARRARLPLVDCVANDLAQVGHVYLPGAGHPGPEAVSR